MLVRRNETTANDHRTEMMPRKETVETTEKRGSPGVLFGCNDAQKLDADPGVKFGRRLTIYDIERPSQIVASKRSKLGRVVPSPERPRSHRRPQRWPTRNAKLRSVMLNRLVAKTALYQQGESDESIRYLFEQLLRLLLYTRRMWRRPSE
jgi:hypothetical protein